MPFNEFPLAYFITFTTYGTRLPGHKSGWIDRRHNRYRTPVLMDQPRLENEMARRMRQIPFTLEAQQRPVVLAAIVGACIHRGWVLLATHVRTNHVHSVVEADAEPEFVANTFKAYSSRKLNQAGFDFRGRIRWTRGESKDYLWNVRSVEAAIIYALEGQGEPMMIYRKSDPTEPRP